MRSQKDRLRAGAELIRLVDRRRQETGMPELGSNVVRMLLDRELADLERSLTPQPVVTWRLQ
ncbi:MAG: hypothetical protein IPM24_23495 [Bryobacterales bacterium]|nr:hypothetical protein [Bryobacterales bacterium]